MWTLRHPSGQLIHLLPDTTTTIGRKSCDLILEDSSVSHLHAKILIKPNNFNDYTSDNKYSSKCIISNAGSKKRTKIIGDKTIYLLPFTNYELQPNDKIHFSSKNEWVVSYNKISLLTCGDCLDQIKNLHKILSSFGGTVFTEWNEDCNFYTTICKRVTPKFVTALAAGLPFVTLKYWKDFYTCCKTRKELPNPLQYILEDWNHTDELKSVSLYPEIARKNLFDNMEFIFFSNDQIDYYGEIIQLAGGRPLMCAKYGFKDKYLLAENTIVIACDESQRTSNSCCGLSESEYQNIYRLLVKEKRKMIDETEIVKAILLCSREKYCCTAFPKFNDSKKPKQVIKNQPSVVIEHTNIIEEDISDKGRNKHPDKKIIKRDISNKKLTKNLDKNIEQDISNKELTKNFNKKIKRDIPNKNVSNNIIEQDISDEHQLYKDKFLKTSPTTHVNEEIIIERQLITSASVVPKLPEAIVKLQKLSPNLISQFKHSQSQSDVNENSTKRKRTNNSPRLSGYKEQSPDITTIDDYWITTSQSRRKPIPNKQLKIINDQLIPEKIILKTLSKNKKSRIERATSSASSLENNIITENAIVHCDPGVDTWPNRQSPTTSNNDKEDSTLKNSKEVPRVNKKEQPIIKEKTSKKSIANKSQVWESYDPHKEKANIKNLPISRKGKITPSTKFTSFFDCYRPKFSSSHFRSKKDTNNKYSIEDNKIKQKRLMINSFLDSENRSYNNQSSMNSKKIPFFTNSENDDNEVPNFFLK